MGSPRRTMTLNLTEDEMSVVEGLAGKKEVSKTSIVKAAIKLYYIIDMRISNGEKIFAEDEKTSKKAELLLL